MTKDKENSHKNHRNRLKEKVKKYGLECLAYHEILELLLTYTIPRKDTNPTAHNLIDYFGNFSNVIDADYHDLLKVDGIGPESALFMNVLSQLFELYKKAKLESGTHVLNNTTKCVTFFRDFYSVKANEFMVIACLGKNKRVIKTFLYRGKDETEITFDIKNIINSINNKGVSSVVLFYTHPFGKVEPSLSDIETTQTILNVCLVNKIELDDHIILNESEHYSFHHNGILDSMRSNHYKVFDAISIYEQIKKQR